MQEPFLFFSWSHRDGNSSHHESTCISVVLGFACIAFQSILYRTDFFSLNVVWVALPPIWLDFPYAAAEDKIQQSHSTASPCKSSVQGKKASNSLSGNNSRTQTWQLLAILWYFWTRTCFPVCSLIYFLIFLIRISIANC